MAKTIRVASINATINPSGKLLKPDKDGYYEVNLGALNVENTSGEYYAAGSNVLALFTDADSFAVKKCRAKELYGEFNHPIMEPEIAAKIKTCEVTKRKWINRQFELRPDRLSHHIKSFTVYETDIKDPITNDNKYLVKGFVKPFGPHGKHVEESLTNPHISATFSLRSLVLENIVNGRVVKTLTYVLTWDSVLTPGIPGSNDQHTMGFEMDDMDIEEIISALESDCVPITATENDKDQHKEVSGILQSFRTALNTDEKITLFNDWK